ncbi:uncharacterized protein FIBRA_07446 [Fibroporia radiculosa]|uniref:Heterokaryon incompatibility domain-containing protein n=1 Tax=Fibroporia radiculosa TaxID=599839 RepID=J4IBT8_9APHY|nr:uncharacterized protein FIBRA_07446 [Fibroporia radiculosa]CCM05236.1 predicted protein [Fibroporia radiculosa]
MSNVRHILGAVVIHESNLASLKGTTLDISAKATPCRYRLVDCAQFTQHQTLRIYELPEFPQIHYSAVSYVWRGLPVDPVDAAGREGVTFEVKGAGDADPTNIDVLHHVCTAALLLQADYLWFDKLCLLQTSDEDKAWQISRMHLIYQSAHVCFVLPGGIGRLASLEEETTWIHRAWTLQEVMLPKRTMVLYSWKLGSGFWEPSGLPPCEVIEVVPQKSAVSSVLGILHGSISGLNPGHFVRGQAPGENYPIIFRNVDPCAPAVKRSAQSQLIALIAVMELEEPEARAQALWRSALTRTSARPVDMVFSIMGLFGVVLDTSGFHQDDRLGATIALAQAILRRGSTASWLGVSFYLAPCRQLSSFPEFPETSLEGRAYVRTENGLAEVGDLMNEFYEAGWWLSGVPTGTMDDTGYLFFSAKAFPIYPTDEQQEAFEGGVDNMSVTPRIVALGGAIWELGLREQSGAARYIVLLGMQHPFSLQGMPRWHAGWSIRAMIVEEHAPGRYHRTSCCMLGDIYKPLVETWATRLFALGGPFPRHGS